MRLLVIAATLLLALPSGAQKQQNAADKHNEVAVQSPTTTAVPAPTVAPSVGYPTTVIQQTNPQQNAEDWPQIFTGIGLIAVGIGGVYVGLQTLKKIEIQAGAAVTAAKAAVDTPEQVKVQSVSTEKAAVGAQRSAEAALLNAQSMINSERPWMLIEFSVKVSHLRADKPKRGVRFLLS